MSAEAEIKLPWYEALRSRSGRWEIGGLAILFLLVIIGLGFSWNRWPDPLIDCGRELYIPWRLAQGDVLYRDIAHPFGPISQYFNAVLFRIFGVGIATLAYANIIISLGIVAELYFLLRRVWGVLTGLLGCFLFVTAFAFSQYIQVGSFNYICPYSHEDTHGMLLLLALALAVGSWVQRPTLWLAGGSGVLLGLLMLTKAEFILAGGAVVFVAVLAGVLDRKREGLVWAGCCFVLGAALPCLTAMVFLSLTMTWSEAATSAMGAIWNVAVRPEFVSEGIQKTFMGTDRPFSNFLGELFITGCAVLTLGFVFLLCKMAAEGKSVAQEHLMALPGAVVVVFAVGWAANWSVVPRCWPPLGILLFGGLVWESCRLFARRREISPILVQRIICVAMAMALLSRMILNPRVHQYGFYQAPLAAAVILGGLLVEFPRWSQSGILTTLYWRGMIGLLTGLACLSYARTSSAIFAKKTLRVGTNGDVFLAFQPEDDARGLLLNQVLARLKDGEQEPLVVWPEGAMVNYLSRTKTSLPDLVFTPAFLALGKERKIVERLDAQPPGGILILSREMKEHGISRFGESEGHGKLLMDWVKDNCTLRWQIGDDPLDSRYLGAQLWVPKKR